VRHRTNSRILTSSPAQSGRRPRNSKHHQVLLNGADGLDFRTTVDCRFFHIITKTEVHEVIGRVATDVVAQSDGGQRSPPPPTITQLTLMPATSQNRSTGTGFKIYGICDSSPC